MRYQRVKMAVTVICVLAACVCYSCKGSWQEPEDGGLLETVTESASDESQEETLLSGEGETFTPCFVHICGEVVNPGVYELEPGSRIFQAIEAAGGFTDSAASEYLNMAEPVCDGMKIVVPDISQLTDEQLCGPWREGTAAAGVTGNGNLAGGSGGKQKVNLNTATKEELMTLKGIGEAKAEDIIAYRESHGGFSKIEDIMKISGIKNAAFEKIKDDITV